MGSYREDTRTYTDGRRLRHFLSVRCEHCYRYCWRRYEYYRRITDTYEYFCESCWIWWQRRAYDFRLSAIARVLPDWMLNNAGNRYNLLLGGDSRPTELLVRRRHVPLYALLSGNGDLSILQSVLPAGPFRWHFRLNLRHLIISMLVHGRLTMRLDEIIYNAQSAENTIHV